MPLPLRLTPLETYYWHDDQDGYSPTYPLDLHFSGVLRREPLENALQVALDRHPMLRATVDPAAGQMPRWVEASARRPQVDWSDADEPIAPAGGERIDLARQTGLRVFVRSGQDASRLLLQFHHACCDAVGALQFAEDLLVTYAALVGGTPDLGALRPLDPTRLALRGDFGLTAAHYRPTLRDVWITARTWARLLRDRPALVAVPRDQQDAPALPYPGFCTQTLEPEDVRELRRISTSHGVTFNDVLLRDLFLTLQGWNEAHAEQGPRRFRINVPTNLRARPDQFMPAANVLSFAFLTRDSVDCRDPRELLRSIHAETTRIKQLRLGLYFVGGLRFGCHIPGLVRWSLRRKGSFATAVLSYVGRVFVRTRLPRQDGKLVCGNVVLQRVAGVPPVRPGTRASLAVILYGGSTSIHLRCDPHYFNAPQTQQLLGAYLDQIRQTIRQGR